jgi:DNA topoisomerase-1
MTSTLQQEASRKLRFSRSDDARRAAAVRERLHHLHAYRLDDAVGDGARRGPAQARELYGAEYVPAEPRATTRKVKNAQEAHEAIRPPATASARPGEVRGSSRRRVRGCTS